MSEHIHPTAIVERGAELDLTVEVGPYAVIGPHVKLGPRTRVGPHAVIGPDVMIGKRCRIGASAVIDGWTEIGDETQVYPMASMGLAPQDLKYKGEPTRLVIGGPPDQGLAGMNLK